MSTVSEAAGVLPRVRVVRNGSVPSGSSGDPARASGGRPRCTRRCGHRAAGGRLATQHRQRLADVEAALEALDAAVLDLDW
jgi:hypothetical protein